MKTLKIIAIYALAMTATVSIGTTGAKAGKLSKGAYAKNIIFMIPDGMGLADVTAARIFKSGPNGDRLTFETLPVIGYQSTHSANSTVTDSAAAASAWASGSKYNNGEISCHDVDFDSACDQTFLPTILDVARFKGKATGLVATSDITHATPAAFGANVHNRNCEEEIARQYLIRKIDVLLGGGISANHGSCMLTPSEGNWFTTLLEEYYYAGYTLVDTKSAMQAAADEKVEKILGLFKVGGKTQELFRVDSTQVYPEEEPTLPEMTQTALDFLEKNRKGFFLMVEGSQIDWVNHVNDIQGQIAETLAFDDSVKVVLDWINSRPKRGKKTLLVVVADHETGGFAINGPYGTLSNRGEIVEDGWTSQEHSAVDTLIWAKGPRSKKFGQALDNTDLFYLMEDAMR